MQKLILPLLFSFILLFVSGCQPESPVSPADQDISFDKGKPFAFTGTVQTDGSGFAGVNLEWAPLRDVEYYQVSYFDLLSGKQKTEILGTYLLSFNAARTMLQISGKSCVITVSAYKYRKGNPVLMASSTKTFTYTGSSLNEININHNNGSNLWTCYTGFACIDVTWPENLSIDHYALSLYASWNNYVTTIPDIGGGMVVWGSMLWSHTLTEGDFTTVTLYAYDSNDAIVGIGSYKIFYTP